VTTTTSEQTVGARLQEPRAAVNSLCVKAERNAALKDEELGLAWDAVDTAVRVRVLKERLDGSQRQR
jgi:hypothetical protein